MPAAASRVVARSFLLHLVRRASDLLGAHRLGGLQGDVEISIFS